MTLADKSAAIERTKFDTELASRFEDTDNTGFGEPATPVGSLPVVLFLGDVADLSTGAAFDCRCCKLLVPVYIHIDCDGAHVSSAPNRYYYHRFGVIVVRYVLRIRMGLMPHRNYNRMDRLSKGWISRHQTMHWVSNLNLHHIWPAVFSEHWPSCSLVHGHHPMSRHQNPLTLLSST